MADTIVNTGLDFFENLLVDPNYTETLYTVTVGNGEIEPSSSSTSLTSPLYESDVVSDNVTIERDSGIGEIRATIEVTGGTEVPSDSEISEIGIKASDGSLVYFELRSSAINIASGETKVIEVRLTPVDDDTTNDVAITNDGRELIADLAVGNATEAVNIIAVGSSTNAADQTDSQMFDEVYRASDSESQVTARTTTNAGEPEYVITISAGSGVDDEVAGGTDISEFGLLSSNSNTLYYHETRNTVTLEANDTKSFNIPTRIVQ